MKINKIVSLFLLSFGLAFSSCEINDQVDNIVRVGYQAPHIYWELPSTSVAAGDPVAFLAQYYVVDKDVNVDHLEVWYNVNEKVQTSVTCPLLSTFKFAMTSEKVNLSREFQKIESFNHQTNLWDSTRKAFVLDSAFVTSKTLRTVEWNEVKDFDNQKFATLFPANFATQFKDSMLKQMKVADYRKMFISLQVMTDVEFRACTDSTFNDNTGGWDYAIKQTAQDLIRSKYNAIEFKDIIFDSSAQLYKIEYRKSYSLDARIKAVDNKQVVGVSDKKTIELR